MNNEELEEIIQSLIEKLSKYNHNAFILDKKTKKLIEEFNMFQKIISDFPDKCDSVLTEIISNFTLKKCNKNELIFDNNIKNITDIFIIFLGEIDIINYYINKKEEKKEEEISSEIRRSNIIIKGREAFGKNFLVKKFRIKKKFNENGDLTEDENCCFKIKSKSKSIIGIITEKIYSNILEKYNAKERLERIYFLQNIEYLPNEQNFIEKFQKLLIKRCFSKNSIISEQNGEIKSIYLIISGLVRLSIAFNKKVNCSLDYDVLIGKLINERFSSSRKFEITGNYREKENMVIVDLGEGEILGGIEFCKNLKNYLFKIACMRNVVLYEIDINDFKNFINVWNLKEFYDKINSQLNFLSHRIANIRNLEKEKSQNDDYSFSQNKFIATYKKGHPLNKKAKEYIKKYTNPFKFGKTFKSKEFKIINTKYSKNIDIKKLKEFHKKQTKNTKNKRNIPFITNLINENFSQEISSNRSKSRSVVFNLKYQKRKLKTDFDDLFITKKEIKKEEEKKVIKNIRMNNTFKLSSSCTSINNNINAIRKKKYFDRRRLNSCKLENNMKLRMSNNNIIESSGHKGSKILLSRNNIPKRLQMSMDNINFMKRDLIEDNKNKENTSIKLQNSSSAKYLIPSKDFNLILQKIRKLSQPSINKKKLTFPHGIQEIKDKESNNIDEIINRIINNSLIKKEFLLNNRERKSQSIILNKNWQK